MTTSRYRRALNSDHWQTLKEEALQRAGGRCEGRRETFFYKDSWSWKRCENRDGLQLHHKHYHSLEQEVLSDVEVLCDGCHKLQTIKDWPCPWCGDQVFRDDSEARLFLNDMPFWHVGLSVGAALRNEQPMCGHCAPAL